MNSDHFSANELSSVPVDPSPEPSGPSGFARLLSVITSPTATFQAVAQNPQPWVGLVGFMLLIALGAAITSHITGPEQMEAALEGPFGGSLAENEDYYAEIEAASHPTVRDRIQGGLIGSAVGVIFIAFVALIYWAVCLVLGGKKGYKRTLDVVFLASWIGAIGQTLTYLLVLAKGTSIGVGISLALLVPNMDPKSPAFILLNTFTSFFSIWQLIVVAIGLGIVHEMSKSKGWLASVIPWLLVSGVVVGLQLAFT